LTRGVATAQEAQHIGPLLRLSSQRGSISAS
jgi:hypothetical protein